MTTQEGEYVMWKVTKAWAPMKVKCRQGENGQLVDEEGSLVSIGTHFKTKIDALRQLAAEVRITIAFTKESLNDPLIRDKPLSDPEVLIRVLMHSKALQAAVSIAVQMQHATYARVPGILGVPHGVPAMSYADVGGEEGGGR